MRSNVLTFLKSSRLSHVAVIFLLALSIRMMYLYEIHDNPFFRHLTLDETAYDEWAQRIAGGEWLGKEIFYQDPLYPYFLGVVYSVIGRDFLWVRALQLFIGSVTCVLLYFMGRLFFDRNTGLVAGIIAALYRPFFYFEAMFLKTFLGVFLICAFIVLLVFTRRRRSFLLWVASGFLLGLLALVRANTLALAGGVVLWLFLTNREAEGVKHKLIATAGFMAGLTVVIGCVFARNYIVGKDFVVLTSQGGQNFFIGNNPWSLSGRYEPPIFIRPHPRYEQEDFLVRAEILTGRKLKPSEASEFWFGEAFDFIKREPRRWLRLMWMKFWRFWNWYEVPDNQNFYFFGRYSRLLRWPLPNFHVVAALGLSGMLLCLPQWRKALLLYLVVILYSATVIAFYVFGRYRLPVVPPLIVFAAYLLSATPTMIAQKKYLKLAAAGVLVIVFFKLLGTHVSPNEYYGDNSNAFCRLASVYQAEGKLDEALSAYTRATEIMPYYWASYFGLGEVYERKDQPDKALENYKLARKYNPGNADICARMGRIYYRKGRLELSAEMYRAATELQPDWTVPHARLANIYEMQGKTEQARAHLRKLTELKVQEASEK